MGGKWHADWCNQRGMGREWPADADCPQPDCPYDRAWHLGTCECSKRSYNRERDCVRLDPFTGDHKMQWLHDGMHLVCTVCGLDGT